MVVGYWHAGGLDFYSVSSWRVHKIVRPRQGFSSLWNQWARMPLVVSRERSLHVRKKYPSTSEENLGNAVQMDVPDLFPFKNPSFHQNLLEKTEQYALIDIWGWDATEYPELRQMFPFTHVLPEDLVFRSKQAELLIWEHNGYTTLMAHGPKGYLGATTIAGTVEEPERSRFIRSLRSPIQDTRMLQQEEVVCPPCLTTIEQIPFKDYTINVGKGVSTVSVEMIGRFAGYALLAYALFLFVMLQNYDRAVEEMEHTLSAAKVQLDGMMPEGTTREKPLREFIKEKVQGAPAPVATMNLLAKLLPPDSYLKGLVLNGKTLEITVSAKDPLEVMNALSQASQIDNLRMKGRPNHVRATKRFGFILQAEMP